MGHVGIPGYGVGPKGMIGDAVFLTNPLCSFELKAQFRNLLYKFKLHCADKSIILFFRDTEVQRE